MISIAHKIELKPNNKQKTYFRKAFGCARLAYNWGLAEWQRQYKEGGKPSVYALKRQFNAIKREQFPFVYEVTKYASQQPFLDLQDAFSRFFKKQNRYPQFKKKKDNEGSFYIGGDQVKLSFTNTNTKAFKKLVHNEKCKHQYLKVPNLGCVKMTECVRFNGKISGVTISQRGNKFYASFSILITEEEYLRTHPKANKPKNRSVGIDLGIKDALILSDGITIKNPKPLYKAQRKLKRLQRQLSKRVHAKTKQERLQGVAKSNNYRELSLKVSRAMHKVANVRRNFINKVTTILTTNYKEISMETLRVQNMMKNHRLARSIADVSFYEIQRQIEYKAAYNGVKVTKADQWYASSQLCHSCGYKNIAVKNLDIRKWTCPQCGTHNHRDFNAAMNLRSLIHHKQIGTDDPEFTPADLTALLLLFSDNGIATSKVETGKSTLSGVLTLDL